MQFVHLHNHTENSLLDGVGTVSEWVKRAKELGMPALAITDHGNMNGVQQMLFSCKQEGIKPIIGVEAYIVDNRTVKQKKEYRNHITLLAKNTEGYKNLIKLVTQANLDGFYNRPRIDFELLKKHSKGLIALSGCYAGVIYQAAKRGDEEGIINELQKHREVFGDDYYVEIMMFPEKGFTEVYPKIVEIAQKQGYPLVLTNDCHYIYAQDNLLQDILFMVRKRLAYTDEKKKQRFKFSLRCLWLKSLPELLKVWKSHYENTISKEALNEAVMNTVKIADKVEPYEIDRSNKYPMIKIKNKVAKRKEINTLLKEKIFKGWHDKNAFGGDKRYLKRLKYEWNILIKKKMSAYFLILADVVQWARDNDILVGYGRGSVAGCLIAYLLGIHRVDPIKHRLLFERFINKSSDSMPDIDVDFDGRYRDEIKKYLINKYGEDKVAEIATYGMMKLKMAIKDIARVYGFDYREINEITKRIGHDEDITKEELRHLTGGLHNKDIIVNLAFRMQGQTRHISVHPAGLVITPTQLTDYIPLQRYKDKIITGWTEGLYRREISDLGLVKYDILGLHTLSIVSDCLRLIKKRHKKEIDLDNLKLDDEDVYENYRRDRVIGIFQCDSSTMRGLIKKLKPREFEDIVALLALDRPAPLSIGIFDKFLYNRRDKNINKQFHPIVWDILKDTHGLLLYQEQVLNLVKKLAQFTSEQRLVMKKLLKKPPKGKAEREAFLKKQKELGKIFIERATNILDKERAEELWGSIKAYGEYGFNRSHSCSYALLSYATMWLKTHYPLEFYAALLNHTREDKIDEYRKEISRVGIEILRADINSSKEEFTIDGNNIRYGFRRLKSIGKSAQYIVQRQPYSSFEAFMEHVKAHRVKICRTVVFKLIKAGAFDDMKERGELIHKYKQHYDKKYIGQPKTLNEFQRLEGEKDVYGFYFSGNLNKLLSKHFVDKDYLPLDKALDCTKGDRVKVFTKIDRVNITNKGIFINVSSGDIKTVIIGWRDNINKFKDKLTSGDIIIADVYRMNYKGKKEFLIKNNSKIEVIGG